MAAETEREREGKGRKEGTPYPEGSTGNSSQQEAEKILETLTEQAEEKLRKSKKRKRELLEGWGLRIGPLEDGNVLEDGKWDWDENLGKLMVERKEGRQSKITTWAGVEGTVLRAGESSTEGRKEEGEEIDQTENIPEGRIVREREEKHQKRSPGGYGGPRMLFYPKSYFIFRLKTP